MPPVRNCAHCVQINCGFVRSSDAPVIPEFIFDGERCEALQRSVDILGGDAVCLDCAIDVVSDLAVVLDFLNGDGVNFVVNLLCQCC